MVKYLSFHNSSFALRYFLNVNGKANTPPCYICGESALANTFMNTSLIVIISRGLDKLY